MEEPTVIEEEDDSPPDWFMAPLSMDQGWVEMETANDLPTFSIKNIHNYFVKRQLQKDLVTATKPFEKGFRIFDAKKVLRPSVYIHKPGSLECIIRATVLPSQRNDTQYKTAVAVNRTNGTVLAATCSCIAGKCSACNHTAALMFAIDEQTRRPASDNLSCTSQLAKWNVPSKGKIPPTPVLDVIKPVYGRKPAKPRTSDSYATSVPVTLERVIDLAKDLEESNCSGLLFHQVWSNPSPQQETHLNDHKPAEE